ncbi:hypothetical protein PHYSODRAFT_330707 [Phytophthora sojae]|uniref:RxLR effector protein n=1 Tax=Phytophthora sojae (strain P6497) TaxID=1094619 RepID=G4ZFW2_PHYSP|nr:hypothetical protein PHYSODRAFT_330707 [Phytophthora sojae]EGZ16646.1 hypothetical protein PHYSODRAFT_330707 [Phytophthora sojae]|eukprot:XP_009525704.1 hypothetical protein PHYSODRAFT_330707 [Phytophthora sojae]
MRFNLVVFALVIATIVAVSNSVTAASNDAVPTAISPMAVRELSKFTADQEERAGFTPGEADHRDGCLVDNGLGTAANSISSSSSKTCGMSAPCGTADRQQQQRAEEDEEVVELAANSGVDDMRGMPTADTYCDTHFMYVDNEMGE